MPTEVPLSWHLLRAIFIHIGLYGKIVSERLVNRLETVRNRQVVAWPGIPGARHSGPLPFHFYATVFTNTPTCGIV